MGVVGALSLIPKHRTLAANTVYVGVPVRRIDAPEPGEPEVGPP